MHRAERDGGLLFHRLAAGRQKRQQGKNQQETDENAQADKISGSIAVGQVLPDLQQTAQQVKADARGGRCVGTPVHAGIQGKAVGKKGNRQQKQEQGGDVLLFHEKTSRNSKNQVNFSISQGNLHGKGWKS